MSPPGAPEMPCDFSGQARTRHTGIEAGLQRAVQQHAYPAEAGRVPRKQRVANRLGVFTVEHGIEVWFQELALREHVASDAVVGRGEPPIQKVR